ARTSPEHPCTAALKEVEWKVLHQMTNPGQALPDRPPALRTAVRQVARLGGFLGRKGDGEPGVKVIWRGLRRLADFVLAFQTFSAAKL
ncbi:MAG TPA: IS4 family transposase, partial [Longimicrobium sp.]|nr:IS4 family transposase [Longimicrobium sp.]